MSESVQAINRRYTEVFDAQYTLVYGEGDIHAKLVLVGEAPGAQEEAMRRPFVGTAGKQLDAFLEGVDMRREDLYITNTVKFRPSKQGTSGRLSNRTPTKDEVTLFRPWLIEELAAVGPRVVATLGNTALRAVTGMSLTIGDVHGRPLESDLPYVIFPLYHPASIIYRRELKDTYAEDVERLRQYMERDCCGSRISVDADVQTEKRSPSE